MDNNKLANKIKGITARIDHMHENLREAFANVNKDCAYFDREINQLNKDMDKIFKAYNGRVKYVNKRISTAEWMSFGAILLGLGSLYVAFDIAIGSSDEIRALETRIAELEEKEKTEG